MGFFFFIIFSSLQGRGRGLKKKKRKSKCWDSFARDKVSSMFWFFLCSYIFIPSGHSVIFLYYYFLKNTDSIKLYTKPFLLVFPTQQRLTVSSPGHYRYNSDNLFNHPVTTVLLKDDVYHFHNGVWPVSYYCFLLFLISNTF